MLKLLLVFVGGGLGSAARYALTLGAARFWPPGEHHPRWGVVHPAGTLAINVVGCLLIGLAWGRVGPSMREEARLLLIVGFLGGFTTFSAVGWESFNLVGRGQAGSAAAYIVATVVLGLTAVWLGHGVGARLVPG